jgi:diketogulonate reductase-like aldo/keto reductase
MTKSKSTKKAAAPKTRKPAKVAVVASEHDEEKATRENLCVFAFRLTEEERDAIHKAAGPAKASKFVRTLAVAAARNDEAAVKAILKAVQSEA